jgi:hypothetical protein
MHPLVRDLYKRFLLVARDYPGGAEVVRRKAKEGFLLNAHLGLAGDEHDELAIKRAVSRGRYMVRELQGVTRLKKYRALKDRYK